MPQDSKPAQRSRLGRGLSSLISSSIVEAATDDQTYRHVTGLPPIAQAKQPVAAAADGRPQEIPLDHIAANPYQPRRQFNNEDLSELAASITQQGILQPLIVARSSQAQAERPYVLVAGERRLRAARQAGLPAVPCIIKDASPQQMLEWALVENIQRSDLNPMEKAEAYRGYVDRFGLTQVQAAERLGQPRTTVSNYLRLLDLQDEVRRMVLDGSLSFGHAKLLAGLLAEPARQLSLARKAAGGGLSVRQLEGLLAAPSSDGAASKGALRKRRAKPSYVLDLEERLTRSLGTRVSILPGRARNTGRIILDYYSLEDFDRIGGMLGLKAEEA
jgi:ParB family chromosome partitioning protein